MDTFSPPFDPQAPQPNTVEQTPVSSSPAPASTTTTPMPTFSTPVATPTTPQPATPTTVTPNQTWMLVLLVGIVLFLSGVGGYLFLWLR